MGRKSTATASTPTYTMGYGPEFGKLLERRNAADCAAHLLPHLRPGMRLLDLGCGPGTISVGLADAVAPGELYGIDMEPSQVEMAGAAASAGGHANARFRTGDVANLPFDDAAFDVAHCHALLNHVPDTRAVLAEAKRVLKPGGLFAARESVSLFEPHTDIVRKGGRETHYGHKVNLATGRSGLVLDAVVETGNPPDSTRCLAMLERHMEHYGAAPSHAAFDGGYASRDNLARARALGVRHVAFHKKSGLKVRDMTSSSWLYDQLKRFRAGIEAGISYLKRCFGLARCRWRGLPHFKAYVHSAVFAHNLARLARLRPRPN